MKTILVVEDNAVNLELLTQLLEDDYWIETAEDGAAGVAAAQRVRPDLVIMDLSLPVVDGWEAIRRIRLDPALARTPIIALSAHAAQVDIERARAVGCDAYLTKPVDDVELERTIGSLLVGARP